MENKLPKWYISESIVSTWYVEIEWDITMLTPQDTFSNGRKVFTYSNFVDDKTITRHICIYNVLYEKIFDKIILQWDIIFFNKERDTVLIHKADKTWKADLVILNKSKDNYGISQDSIDIWIDNEIIDFFWNYIIYWDVNKRTEYQISTFNSDNTITPKEKIQSFNVWYLIDDIIAEEHSLSNGMYYTKIKDLKWNWFDSDLIVFDSLDYEWIPLSRKLWILTGIVELENVEAVFDWLSWTNEFDKYKETELYKQIIKDIKLWKQSSIYMIDLNNNLYKPFKDINFIKVPSIFEVEWTTYIYGTTLSVDWDSVFHIFKSDWSIQFTRVLKNETVQPILDGKFIKFESREPHLSFLTGSNVAIFDIYWNKVFEDNWLAQVEEFWDSDIFLTFWTKPGNIEYGYLQEWEQFLKYDVKDSKAGYLFSNKNTRNQNEVKLIKHFDKTKDHPMINQIQEIEVSEHYVEINWKKFKKKLAGMK